MVLTVNAYDGAVRIGASDLSEMDCTGTRHYMHFTAACFHLPSPFSIRLQNRIQMVVNPEAPVWITDLCLKHRESLTSHATHLLQSTGKLDE